MEEKGGDAEVTNCPWTIAWQCCSSGTPNEGKRPKMREARVRKKREEGRMLFE